MTTPRPLKITFVKITYPTPGNMNGQLILNLSGDSVPYTLTILKDNVTLPDYDQKEINVEGNITVSNLGTGNYRIILSRLGPDDPPRTTAEIFLDERIPVPPQPPKIIYCYPNPCQNTCYQNNGCNCNHNCQSNCNSGCNSHHNGCC